MDWAWLAGFIDGEGCFTFRRQAMTHGGYIWSPRLTITQTDRKSLTDIVRWLGAGHVIEEVAKGVKNPHYRRSYVLHFQTRTELERVCRGILPHLRIKQGQARMILDCASKHTRDLGPEAEEMKALNHAGEP